MKSIYGALAATLACATALASVNAAEIPAAPAVSYKETPYIYSWTGIYAGIQGGGMWGTEDVFFPFNGGRIHPDVSGGVLGGQLGAQFQFPSNIVVGVEASGVGSSADGSDFCTVTGFGVRSCRFGVRNEIQVVGRLGYAFGNILPYIKGGYANVAVSSGTFPVVAGFDLRRPQDGWVVGGGIEYGLTDHIILGIDYSHIETDTTNYLGPPVGGFTRNIDTSIDMITARVSLKIWPWGPAPMK